MFEKILKNKAIKVIFVLPRANSAAEVLQTCSGQKFIRDVNNTVALLCSSPLSFRRHCLFVATVFSSPLSFRRHCLFVTTVFSSPLSFRRHCFHLLRRLVLPTPYRLPQSPSVFYMIINLSNLNTMYVFNWSLLQIGFSAIEIQEYLQI